VRRRKTIPGTLSGSNNLTFPISTRVRERLNELRTKGKPSFRKGENKRWMTIPAEVPIHGPLAVGSNVTFEGSSLEDCKWAEIRYEQYAVEEAPNGSTRVKTIFRKAGPGDPGINEKIVDCEVIERFEKGKPFSQKITEYDLPEEPRQSESSKARDRRVRGEELGKAVSE